MSKARYHVDYSCKNNGIQRAKLNIYIKKFLAAAEIYMSIRIWTMTGFL